MGEGMELELNAYMLLLQVSAVTVVACVLILAVSVDLFGIEATGTVEPGGGPPILALKYRGKTAASCRHIVFGTGAFLVAAYTPLLLSIVLSVTAMPGYFRPALLIPWLIVVVAVTILAVSWIAFLAIVLRWVHMRRSGARRTV
jgi:hypothetical protein